MGIPCPRGAPSGLVEAARPESGGRRRRRRRRFPRSGPWSPASLRAVLGECSQPPGAAAFRARASSSSLEGFEIPLCPDVRDPASVSSSVSVDSIS